jgi:hypothetical protein
MSPVRLVFLMTACTALAAPLASHAAQPATVASADVCAPRMTLTERRIVEHSGTGMSDLVSYVHLTQPIYQVTVDQAVAIAESQRASRQACAVASAR